MENIPETLYMMLVMLFFDMYDIEPYNYYPNAQVVQNKIPHKWSDAVSSIN